MELSKQLEDLKTTTDMEELERIAMITYLDEPNVFERSNTLGHFCSSAWIINQTHDKVLLIYHNLYDSWGWCGGHADGEHDLLKVALKEAKEETGLNNLKPLSDRPISCEILTVHSHYKHGLPVHAHLHFNVTYAFVADDSELLRIKEDENSGVEWFLFDEYERYVREVDMLPVYRKLMRETKKLIGK